VQMLAPSLAKFGPLGVKEFEVFDLPFIFKDQAAFRAVTEGPVGADLFKKLEPKGIKGLAYWDNGFHIMSANKPLHHVADFKGLKMRIQSSKVLDAQMRALGAIPQVMAFSELYQALQSGVVDGCEGVPSNFYTQKTYEVQKHTTISNHGHLAYAVIVNKKFWDGLPADIRTQLEGALKEATVYANAMAETENVTDLEKMRASLPALPVVVVSGSDDTRSVLRALDLGAMGYIPKTSPRDVLLGAVRLVASGGIYVPVEALKARDAGEHAPAASSSKTAADLGLSARQWEVLGLLLKGLPNKLIARKLEISENTTKIHVSAVLRALGVSSRTQALLAANRLGLRLDA